MHVHWHSKVSSSVELHDGKWILSATFESLIKSAINQFILHHYNPKCMFSSTMKCKKLNKHYDLNDPIISISQDAHTVFSRTGHARLLRYTRKHCGEKDRDCEKSTDKQLQWPLCDLSSSDSGLGGQKTEFVQAFVESGYWRTVGWGLFLKALGARHLLLSMTN